MVIEEIRRSTRDKTSNTKKEEYCALDGKGKKSKGNKSQGEEGKRDLSKIKCFHYHEHEHYALNCQQLKASKKEPAVVVGEAIGSHLELNFSLIACMTSTVMGCMWYLDSDASFHMKIGRAHV